LFDLLNGTCRGVTWQARTVIERSGSWLCIGEVEKNNTCTYGQLPHHFVGTTPTFLALSGATQTGPNTFWTKAALQYARNSGNLAWLKSYMVRAALLVSSFVAASRASSTWPIALPK
jgi:hypothetical protein